MTPHFPANTRQLAAQAWALHQAGKHEESVAKYDEAAKAAGITLQHKQ
jgi:3-methyladenine DNA glycosylase AlkD